MQRSVLAMLPLLGLIACSSPDAVPVDDGAPHDVTDDKGDAPVSAASPTINSCVNYCPDLVLDTALLAGSIVIESREFPDPTEFDQAMPHPGADCSVAEGSVGGTGVRRLLRFSTGATNIGKGDLLLGSPTDPTRKRFFEYAPCHGHYHFSGFASYKLLAADGTVALDGHKQAFCIEDNIDKLHVNPHPAHPTTCASPGLHRGWSDIYYNHTEANWIDITDIPPGTYTLVVSLNEQRVIKESKYSNNNATLKVTIPADPSPKVCPADTEALFRCDPSTQLMSRCYAGRKDTAVCATGSSCVQPSELSHQAHCGTGGAGTIRTDCPSDVSTTPYCDSEVDALTGTTRAVRRWCDGGTIETEYCGGTCGAIAGGGGMVCLP